MKIQRKVVPEDIGRIRALIAEATGGRCADIERMGGLTNHSYRVRLEDGRQFAVRIPGEGTEEMIVRGDEHISTRLACALDIDARLLYFGPDGAKVTEYIPEAVTMSPEALRAPERMREVAEILGRLHRCGQDTGVAFDVFGMAENYERIIAEGGVPMYADYARRKAEVARIKSETDRTRAPKLCPCHNDPLCENWVAGGGRLYLIDWEYAGMNDGMWDVADVSIEAGYDAARDETFLALYLGRTPDADDRKHLLACKVFVDYLWTLWAKTRVPFDGAPMEEWAAERYARMKGNIAAWQRI